jgi:hypothetical protein
LEIADNNNSEGENEDDDNSSTENLRHGYLPINQQYKNESINSLTKKLNVQTSIVWEGKILPVPIINNDTNSVSILDYRPQYRLLNESYDNVKKGNASSAFTEQRKILTTCCNRYL